MGRKSGACLALLALFAFEGGARAAESEPVFAAGGQSFATWSDYYESDYFATEGKRCGKPKSVVPASFAPSDCSFTSTNPSPEYEPGDVYQIPVVVHIIEHANGNGRISDALVHTQIEVLNEDFRALTGTPGQGGYDAGIQFVLATRDPAGNPTSGITRSVNNTWFSDGGRYWDSLAWDTSRYLNVYTNQAGGNLGYVPSLPQGGLAGDPADRIVVLWSAFGRGAVGGPPFDQGRTLTHEVGHYLGLEHTFEGGCGTASVPACYSSGDLVCDTNAEANERFGCPGGAVSCGSPDPIENYMDYSDDTCMERFTREQSRRMRCSLIHYRSDVYAVVEPGSCGNGVPEPGEQCDGDAAGNCPTGVCDPDCTCEDPVCGNAILEQGEQCDGAADAACPGACLPSCACGPTCGDGQCLAGETAGSCPADCGCSASGACGDQAPGGCYCDSECESFGDCCADVCSACGFACLPEAGCDPAPVAPCRDTAALGGTLVIKDAPGADRDRLVWKVSRGAATALEDFLDPVTPGGTASLCLYDASREAQPLLAAAVPTGVTCGSQPCWKAQSTSGFKYASKGGNPAGITSVRLQSGDDGSARIQVKAGGPLLANPDLPLEFPVVAQFLLETGQARSCWQSEFAGPLRNDPLMLKAVGP